MTLGLFVHSFVHPFILQYFLNIYYEPGIVLDVGEKTGNKTSQALTEPTHSRNVKYASTFSLYEMGVTSSPSQDSVED